MHCERAGHRRAAPLSGGNGVGWALRVLDQPHGLERLADARAQRVVAQAEVGRTERDVGLDRRHEQLVVGILEYDPYLGSHAAPGSGAEPHTTDRHLSAAW